MDDSQKPQFLQLLATTLAMYGKSMPEAAIAKAWIAAVAPYPLDIVRAALQTYCDENGEFAPVPAGIAMRCKLMDGRPGAEAAWATALNSRDESNTVVWTSECASAFALCQPVLAAGDEVGARMAFKEVYIRLVALARAQQRPAEWSASLGWSDRGSHERRLNALGEAERRGLLLPAPIAGLLEGPQPTSDTNAREQLQTIRKMLADGERDKRRKLEWREYEIYLDDLLYKALTNTFVEEYQRDTQNTSPFRVTAHSPTRNKDSALRQSTFDCASPVQAAITNHNSRTMETMKGIVRSLDVETDRRLGDRHPKRHQAISNGASHGI
jgi:hypothetical protein